MLLNGFYLLALLLLSPWMFLQSLRTGKYRSGWNEKLFGSVPSKRNCGDETRTLQKEFRFAPTVWVHAVSVGEVQLAKTLIELLSTRWPQATIVVSSTSETGISLCRKYFSDRATFFMPFDFTWAVRRAISRIQPDLLILCELEVWPNLISTARSNGCKIAIINGRLSDRSYRGYKRFRGWISTFFKSIDYVGAQDSTYAERFISLGTERNAVEVTGNVKFDGLNLDRESIDVKKRAAQYGIHSGQPVVIFGSTQSPEENFALMTFRSLIQGRPNLRLILVPRHPERANEVVEKIREFGFRFRRRSKDIIDNPAIENGDWQVLLVDTVGELKWWWAVADVAFVGGSFGDRGGQNMLEPIAYGIPTAVGPNTKNFADIMKLLREAGLVVELSSPEYLIAWIEQSLCDESLQSTMQRKAADFVSSHAGAAERTVDSLERVLSVPKAES